MAKLKIGDEVDINKLDLEPEVKKIVSKAIIEKLTTRGNLKYTSDASKYCDIIYEIKPEYTKKFIKLNSEDKLDDLPVIPVGGFNGEWKKFRTTQLCSNCVKK